MDFLQYQFPRPRLLVALTAVAVALAVTAPSASANTVLCPNGSFNGGISLIDSGNNVWDLDSFGEAQDGGHDAWDGFSELFVNNDSSPYDSSVTYPNFCDLGLNGQQLSFPETDSPVAGLMWSRKVYAPSTGTPFARWVDFLHNTSGSDIVLPTMRWGGDLGSDSNTQLDADSSGDHAPADPNTDFWWQTSDGFGFADHDPAIGEVFDGAGAPDAADHIYTSSTGTTPWANGNEFPNFTYDNVTVPAGQTIAYMHILTVSNTSQSDAASQAALLSTGNAGEAFRGLSLTELGEIQNWNAGDADGDGKPNASDNCPTNANADQADLDKDGIGDVCDDDKDGDGISNADEAIRGTDPAKADTDGDGINDKVDACPTKAGLGADGCPRFDTQPTSPPATAADKTPPAVTLTVSKRLKRKAFLRGVTVKVTSNEASTVLAQLSASAKKVTISKAYNLLLANKSLASGSGTRSLTLKPSKKLVGKAKKFSVQLKVTATDASGNSTLKTVVIKVS